LSAAKDSRRRTLDLTKAQESDPDVNFLADVTLRWSVSLMRLQEASLGSKTKFLSRKKFEFVFHHLGMKFDEIPTLTQAYLDYLSVCKDDTIHFEWFLAISFLLYSLRYAQLFRDPGEFPNALEFLANVRSLPRRGVKLDDIFGIVLRLRLMIQRHLDSFWGHMTTADAKLDFHCRNEEFFRQLYKHGADVNNDQKKFFLHFLDPFNTSFVNYKTFVWNLKGIAGVKSDSLSFPQNPYLRSVEKEKKSRLGGRGGGRGGRGGREAAKGVSEETDENGTVSLALDAGSDEEGAK